MLFFPICLYFLGFLAFKHNIWDKICIWRRVEFAFNLTKPKLTKPNLTKPNLTKSNPTKPNLIKPIPTKPNLKPNPFTGTILANVARFERKIEFAN